MPNRSICASLTGQFPVWHFVIWNCHFSLLKVSIFISVYDIPSLCGHIPKVLLEIYQPMHAVCLTKVLRFCRLSPSSYHFTAPMALV
jgi:hypothetical protein